MDGGDRRCHNLKLLKRLLRSGADPCRVKIFFAHEDEDLNKKHMANANVKAQQMLGGRIGASIDMGSKASALLGTSGSTGNV